jgi:hypothetical protein
MYALPITSDITTLPEPATPAITQHTADAAQRFSASVFGTLLNMMMQTVPVDPVLGGGQAEEMFRSMVVDAYSTAISARDPLHIRAMLTHYFRAKHDATTSLQGGTHA